MIKKYKKYQLCRAHDKPNGNVKVELIEIDCGNKYQDDSKLIKALQEYHASILSDNLYVMFAENRKFISSEGVKLIADYATEPAFS